MDLGVIQLCGQVYLVRRKPWKAKLLIFLHAHGMHGSKAAGKGCYDAGERIEEALNVHW